MEVFVDSIELVELLQDLDFGAAAQALEARVVLVQQEMVVGQVQALVQGVFQEHQMQKVVG